MKTDDKAVEMSNIPVAGPGVSYFRTLGFLLACALPFFLAWDLMRVLASLVGDDTFSQVPLIPLVSLFLIYSNRAAILDKISVGWALGAALIVPGIVCLELARRNVWQLEMTNQMSLLVLGMVLFWMGSFALVFGVHAFRAACFPLLFLLFTIPIPEPLLSNLTSDLQKGSAGAAEMFFRIGGIPNLRQGLEFSLPGVRIRVAEECSGIRSTLALLITTVLACHLFLRRAWKRALLCVVVVPIAIIKNGLRISALSALAIYVDPGFLYGNLHHYGGIVFFVFALAPMALLLLLLQRGETPGAPMANVSRPGYSQ